MKEAVVPQCIVRRHGITLRILKDFLENVPDKDHMDEDCEVWLGGPRGLSNMATRLSPLNMRTRGDGVRTCSIIFDSEESEKEARVDLLVEDLKVIQEQDPYDERFRDRDEYATWVKATVRRLCRERSHRGYR